MRSLEKLTFKGLPKAREGKRTVFKWLDGETSEKKDGNVAESTQFKK